MSNVDNKEIGNLKNEEEVEMTPSFLTKKIKKLSLEEQQKEEGNILNSEYTSFKDFEKLGLKPKIVLGCHEKGFDKPSKIQGMTIPFILKNPNSDLLAQSQSGTGKTCCFATAMLQSVDETLHEPQAICICPTLELAKQNLNIITDLGKYLDVKILGVLKGTFIDSKITEQIVVGTPGKIFDMIRRRYLETENIKLYVLDEADAILQSNTSTMTQQAVMIRKRCPDSARALLFSATFKEEVEGETKNIDEKREQQVLNFANKVCANKLKVILLPKKSLKLKYLHQYAIQCQNMQDKMKALQEIFTELSEGQSIIFVNTKQYAMKIAEELKSDGYPVELLTGDLEPQQRIQMINALRDNKIRILIATDVLSRGIDVRTILLVVNFDLPRRHDGTIDIESYVHRIGRTARFGAEGHALNLCMTQEDFAHLQQLQNYLELEIPPIQIKHIKKLAESE